MNKTSFLTSLLSLSLSAFLLTSCGKNPFVNADPDDFVGTPGLGAEEDEIFLDMQKELSFGNLILDDKNELYVNIENRGDIAVDSVGITEVEGPYSLVEETCSERVLDVLETCYLKYEFSPSEVGEFDFGIVVTASGSGKTNLYNVAFSGKGISSDGNPGDGGLNLNYLNSSNVNFGKVKVASSYSKLVRVSNTSGARAGIIAFRSSYNADSSLGLSTGDLGCSEIIENDCYLDASLLPKSNGAKKEYLYVDYAYEGESEIRTLVISVDYRASANSGTNCTESYEVLHSTKEEAELTDYEKSLHLPYYNKARGTRLTIGRLMNTEYTDRIDIEGRSYLYVENAQVFISYGVSVQDEIIKDARLELHLDKFIDAQDPNSDTEILCNLDMKVCSGKQFTSRQNRCLINRSFKLKNNRFSRTLMNEGTRVEDLLQLKRSFNLTHYLDMKKSNYTRFVKKNGSLSFAIADDTRIVSAPILFTERSRVKSCEI